jgi:hypothetical protein
LNGYVTSTSVRETHFLNPYNTLERSDYIRPGSRDQRAAEFHKAPSKTDFERIFDVLGRSKRKIYLLEAMPQSSDAIEIVAMAIEKACLRRLIFVKDADNHYRMYNALLIATI